MNELMRILIELQSLEFEETIQPNIEKRIAALRAKIPKPILSHYDRLGDQGKKGLAAVRNQTCTGCHMRVPVAVVFNLKHAEDVCLCDNCGRYLYLPEPAAEVAAEAPVEDGGKAREKTAAKNGRKQLAHAL
jgi:predicted  nucleic acid-binding Zn-ribbon protein